MRNEYTYTHTYVLLHAHSKFSKITVPLVDIAVVATIVSPVYNKVA